MRRTCGKAKISQNDKDLIIAKSQRSIGYQELYALRAVGVLVILSSIIPIALLLGSISATEPDQDEISAQQLEFEKPLPESIGEAVEKIGEQVVLFVNASEPREEVELEEPVAEISEGDFLSLEGHVLEWAFITVFRELTISQKEYIVRAELTESDFSMAPWLKDFLDDVNAKTSQWEETCTRDNRIDFRICTPLSGSRLTLDEVRLNSVLELVNPEPPDFRKGLPLGEVQIYYESIIYLDGRTYVIIVGTKWVALDHPLQEKPLSFRGATLSLQRASGSEIGLVNKLVREGALIQSNITDADLVGYPRFRNAFEEVHLKMLEWETICPAEHQRAVWLCPERTTLYFDLTEAEFNALIQLANLDPSEPNRERILSPSGDTRKSYDSIIELEGIQYIILIDSRWLEVYEKRECL